MNKQKKKKCKAKGCNNTFNQMNSLHVACSLPCSMKIVELKNNEVERKQAAINRLKKEALRPKSWYIKKAQAAFNAFVRERDKDLPCISCQRHHNGQYHAGHYLTTGSRPELRFHPANNNKQCAPCNNHLSGNIVLYRKNLIDKIGQDLVDYLENFNQPQLLKVEDLKEIADHYKKELKILKKS